MSAVRPVTTSVITRLQCSIIAWTCLTGQGYSIDQGFPSCQTQIQGVSESFLGSNTKIRHLVPRNVFADLNFDQLRCECQRSTRIDGGVSRQNKVGHYDISGWY